MNYYLSFNIFNVYLINNHLTNKCTLKLIVFRGAALKNIPKFYKIVDSKQYYDF